MFVSTILAAVLLSNTLVLAGPSDVYDWDVANSRKPIQHQVRPRQTDSSAPSATIPTSSSIQSPITIDIGALLSSLSSDLSASTSTGSGVSSLISSPSSQLTTTPSVTPTSSSPSTSSNSISSSTSSPSAPTAEVAPASSDSSDHHTLVIILVVVFAILGLFLLFLIFALIQRYRHRKSPFSKIPRRHPSPVDDDEIATWRGKAAQMGQVPGHHRTSSSVVFSPAPGWTWTVQSSPASTAAGEGSSSTPPMVARAPNSRTGLTDEAVPSADPFISPPRRQSTRLSKVPGHGRTKSRRSSASTTHADRAGIWNASEAAADEDGIRRQMSRESRSAPGAATRPIDPYIIDGTPQSPYYSPHQSPYHSPRSKPGSRTITSFELPRPVVS